MVVGGPSARMHKGADVEATAEIQQKPASRVRAGDLRFVPPKPWMALALGRADTDCRPFHSRCRPSRVGIALNSSLSWNPPVP